MGISFYISDNKKFFLSEMDEKVETALETCGLVAEGYAKRLCPVDTGLLRNSITHAMSGETAAISSYTDNDGSQSGEYKGSAPSHFGAKAMYIGTNVEYAPYVEMGTSSTNAQPFIKPAVTGHTEQYKRIVEGVMKK